MKYSIILYYTIASVLHVLYCSILNFTVLLCAILYSGGIVLYGDFILYIIIPLRQVSRLYRRSLSLSFQDFSHQQKQTPGVYICMIKPGVINDETEYIMVYIAYTLFNLPNRSKCINYFVL